MSLFTLQWIVHPITNIARGFLFIGIKSFEQLWNNKHDYVYVH